MEPVLVERAGAIATVVLNDRENRNALTAAAWRRLAGTMRELAADETLRCVVLRGAGDQAFSAGADLTEFAAARASAQQARDYARLIESALAAVAGCRHPTLASIRGACEAEALSLAAACDLRICAASSTFSLPAGRRGSAMGPAELAIIRGLAGPATTLELLLEGRVLAAPEAYRRRLVNRVVSDGELEREAYAAAERVAAGAPLAARWNKQFIERMSVDADVADAEREAGFACYDTDDYQAALAAIASGRAARFKGR